MEKQDDIKKAIEYVDQRAVKILGTLILGLSVWTLKTVVDMRVLVAENIKDIDNNKEWRIETDKDIKTLFGFHLSKVSGK